MQPSLYRYVYDCVYVCVCVCMHEEEFKGLMGIIGTQRATLALREGLVTK